MKNGPRDPGGARSAGHWLEAGNSEWRIANRVDLRAGYPQIPIRYSLRACGPTPTSASGLSGPFWNRQAHRIGVPGGPERGSAACGGHVRAPLCPPKPAAAAPGRQAGAAPRDRQEPARSSPAVGFWTAWPKLNTKQPTGPLSPPPVGPSGAPTGPKTPARPPASPAAPTDLRTHEKTDPGQARDRRTLREFQFPE